MQQKKRIKKSLKKMKKKNLTNKNRMYNFKC